ncbi:PIR Superfamily Protein [Plasmodium ovale curtisi]|uniref:PIR Superfamily Protein n=1 Tax=Plasmodium ovale curtisi TaxID=864141 RepID=A0A1A8WR87_PLAOA|nr:PIR Superfamily Protein [Plasmodium ovale curtisi]
MDHAETILEGSHSHNIYDKLNSSGKNYDKFCKGYSYYKNICPPFYELCVLFETNINTLTTLLGNEVDDADLCRYLNFWIHDEIKKASFSYKCNTHEKTFIRKISSISHRYNSSPSKNKCHFYVSALSLDTWIKWKNLYDYIKSYSTIKNTVTADNNKCKVYPEYIEYIKGIHKEYKEQCCKSDTSNCPQNIKFDVWCNKDIPFTELECNVFQTAEQDFDTEISEKEGKSSHEHISSDPRTLTPNNLNYNIIISAILSLLTPIKFWIQRILRRNKNDTYIEDEATNKLWRHTSEIMDINSENSEYHITYNSV